jgi:hypothetical protein
MLLAADALLLLPLRGGSRLRWFAAERVGTVAHTLAKSLTVDKCCRRERLEFDCRACWSAPRMIALPASTTGPHTLAATLANLCAKSRFTVANRLQPNARVRQGAQRAFMHRHVSPTERVPLLRAPRCPRPPSQAAAALTVRHATVQTRTRARAEGHSILPERYSVWMTVTSGCARK